MQFIFILLIGSWIAPAAPNYPLEILLLRSETVFIGRVSTATDEKVILTVSKVLRGSNQLMNGNLAFRRDSGGSPPTKGATFFVLSQGDNHFGKPEQIISIGQPSKGQAGYRGWIMLPIIREEKTEIVGLIGSSKVKAYRGMLTLDQAKQLVREADYKPDLYGKPPTPVAPKSAP